MPTKSEFDLATDILKERITLAHEEIKRRTAHTNPYRQKPLDPKEAIYQYSQLSPEMIEQAKLAMGEDVVNHYIAKMEAMIRRQHA